MIMTGTCKTCGEFHGYFSPQNEPQQVTIAYCRCRPEGWELCSKHPGNVRRRFRTTRITDADGTRRYFSAIAMMAPCRDDTCFKPAPEFLKQLDTRKGV